MKRRNAKPAKSALRRAIYTYARFLHIYISTALFALLIFFCITGFFLNHLDTFGGSASDESKEIPFTPALSELFAAENAPFENPPLAALKQYVQQQHGLSQFNRMELDEDAGELILDYSLPAGYASAIFLVEDETLLLEYQKGSVLAVMNDLHKGRHTGGAWSWVIDLSALFMVLFAITGFILVFQNKRQRANALWVTALGVATPVIIYFVWVPSITGV
ncbi:PepSY-associated TM helix domain-containing protein [Saccharophagus degradans]|uniref:PepSY-associated TM helix domain-containing protein n=1 Tax=Saccharophagus degradans TaxID=86304 RepID=UPI002478034B|nr:PepSY-associated TM helix domain-containing protein [Saccharophagus degradans]WGO99530.1 PepSY-associated TM helix domain-containing protein [Saccharophagus degradans]